MYKQLLLLSLSASFLFGQATLSITGGNLVLTGGANNISAIEFTATPSFGTSFPTLSSALMATPSPGKTLYCNSPAATATTICVIAGINANAIPDGPLMNWSGAFVPTNISAASPTGTVVSLAFNPSACDLNKDGIIDAKDFTTEIGFIILSSPLTLPLGDINGDGKIDLNDLFRIITAITTGVCKVGP